ncbi:hypothetical protein VNO77_06033 [Canavalia gladiata]|uniref:UspA domain-containing protein n=1 Tax=Canavalia gladiata TaxID=3824 RepID=A0AAN9RER7_CANGL
MSWEREQHECIHDNSDEELSFNCSCSLMGFRKNQVMDYGHNSSSSEIGDGEDSEDLFEINLKEPLSSETIREEDCESTVFSLDIHNVKDVVYVAVGLDKNRDSSMEALSWALKHAVTSSTTVSLIHVFPKVNFIPSPLGKIPRSHVKLEYVNIHLAKEIGKRKLLLQNFIDLCVDSKVNVEMMVIEGDNVAKAIADLVGNLNIRKLVIGATKFNLRKSIAEKVLNNADENCDVKIICQGREVIDQLIGCTSPPSQDNGSLRVSHVKDERLGVVPRRSRSRGSIVVSGIRRALVFVCRVPSPPLLQLAKRSLSFSVFIA